MFKVKQAAEIAERFCNAAGTLAIKGIGSCQRLIKAWKIQKNSLTDCCEFFPLLGDLKEAASFTDHVISD